MMVATQDWLRQFTPPAQELTNSFSLEPSRLVADA
jgi:hypothetical protein